MKLETLFARFGGRCVYCGKEVTIASGTPKPHSATCDHFIPRARGGHEGRSNKVLACYACNQAKGNMDPRLVLFVWLWLNPDSFNAAIRKFDSINATGTTRH